MTIEKILVELKTKCDILSATIAKKQDEVNEMLEDNDSLKKNCNRIISLRNEINELNEDLKYYAQKGRDITILSRRLEFANSKAKSATDENEKNTYEYMAQLIRDELFDAINAITGLDKKEDEEVISQKDSSKKYKNKNAILKHAIALTLAAVAVIGAYHCAKNSKGNDNKLGSSFSQMLGENDEISTGDKVKFTNVNNTAQVSQVADAFLESLNALNPNNDYTKEEIIKMVQIINGGTLENATSEEVANLFFRLFDIMGEEALYASNMINGYEIEDDKRNGLINYTELTLDGTRGEALVEKIENARAGMISNPSKEGASASADEFMRLFVESWYLNGDKNEIPMSTLETPGMKVFANMLMDSSANLADSVNPRLEYNRNIKVNGEEETQTFYLDELYNEFNSAKCQEDGMFSNDFSAYLDETIKTLKLK